VPFVSFLVSVCVLLNLVELSTNNLAEFRDLHAFCRKFSDVKSTCFIVWVRKSMGTIILRVLKVKLFTCLVHFLEEEHNLVVFLIMGVWSDKGRVADVCAGEYFLGTDCWFVNCLVFDGVFTARVVCVNVRLEVFTLFKVGYINFEFLLELLCFLLE